MRRTHPVTLLLVLALRWFALSWTTLVGALSGQVQQRTLAGLGLIDIGKEVKEGEAGAFFTRNLRLVTDESGPTFSPTEQGATAMQ